MRNVLFFLLFIAITPVSYAAHTPVETPEHQSFNKYDISIATTLQQMMVTSQFQISYRTAKKLRKDAKHSTLFSGHQALFNTITQITYVKSPTTTYKYCTHLEENNDLLSKELISWCHDTVIEKFKSRRLKKRQRQKFAQHFFNSVSKNILDQKSFLKELFSELSNRETIHKILSSKFLSLLISEGRSLPKSFATIVDIAPEYEDFVKIKDKNSKHPTQKFIHSQLSKIRKEYYKASRQKDFVKLKELSQQILSILHDNYDDFRSYDLKTVMFIGQALQKLNYIKQARKYFKQLYLLGKSKDPENNPFVFEFLWSYVKEEDYKGGLAALYQNDIIDQLEHYSNKLQFWIAYVFQKNNEYKIAHYIYSRIIEESPLDYYATMSDGQLEYNKNLFAKKIIRLTQRTPTKSPHQLPKNLLNKIQEINLWQYVGHSQYAQQQISLLLSGKQFSLGKKSKEIKETRYLILDQMLSFLRSEKLYLSLFQTVFQNMDSISPKSLKSVIKYLFPFEYYSKISNLTETANPIVILSLIRQESGFNPKAQSAPGARGLMQIMPRTAEEMNVFNIKDLYNPKKNIQAGIKYFEYLLETFDSNLVYALASYNAGPHRVKDWMNSIFKSNNPLIMIENIPYKETKKYVKLIYRNVYFYNLLHKI